MVTEFGAEANRDGPVEEKGTWAFQQDFVNFHLGVYAHEAVAERRALLGAQRVPRAPGVGGRQPAADAAAAPEGPARATATSSRKPAWADLQRNYAATQQFGCAAASAGRGGAAAPARAPGGAAGCGVRSRRRSCGAQPDRGGHRVGQRQAAGR